MNNEEEIYEIRNKALKKIKQLKFVISQMELERYNLDLKNKQTEAKYNLVKSRNVDLTKRLFDLKKRDARFRKKLEEYENCISLIKQYFQLECIEEISNYIQKNIIEKKSDLEAKEKELEMKQMNIDVEPDIEMPKGLNVNRPKR
ncbi:hypothetical protein [Alteromonas flava]|uniref:hypothetical protein n=1 Tax=Alteromonas flava TaxID=2048003 RepID=UPI000C282875|nr:hypothetical protein [Alteromonas flava]